MTSKPFRRPPAPPVGNEVNPAMADKHPGGRPPMEFNPEFADILCAVIAQSEKSLATILKALAVENPTTPSITTVMRWLRANEEFSQQYARAKEEQADYLAEQIIEISDDSSQDEIFIGGDDETGASAKRVMNSEFVQRSKLRVDARKWVAAKLKPKKYGDKMTLSGDPENPLQTMTDEQLTARLAALRDKSDQ